MADVHRDPELLRIHARTAAALADTAAAAVRGWADQPVPAAERAELDRIVTAVGHAVAELSELSAVLNAAAAVDGVDADVRARVRQVLGP